MCCCCAGAARHLSTTVGSNSKIGAPAAAGRRLQQIVVAGIGMNETIMLQFCSGQQQPTEQGPPDCSNCSRCTSECRVDCCARFASEFKVISDVSTEAGVNPCTWNCARACRLVPSSAVMPNLNPTATGGAALIKQQYQRLKASTVPSAAATAAAAMSDIDMDTGWLQEVQLAPVPAPPAVADSNLNGSMQHAAVAPTNPLSTMVPIGAPSFAAATGSADAIKRQYQRLQASTVPSSPGGFKSPDEFVGPDVPKSEGNFTASATAATAMSDILRQQYQLESAIQAGAAGTGASPNGSMQGKASSNATTTRKNGTGSL